MDECGIASELYLNEDVKGKHTYNKRIEEG
jgi:hypothetical protein